ncbi:MAG: hypothetical protein M3Y44_06265 [Actinomycetota bacterium]|nr:hypothetical protein [Actinomycetota bacterium]
MPSLTPEDAQRRGALVSVGSYDIRLDLTAGEETFVSTTTIRFDASDAGTSTFLDVTPRMLRGAVLNGPAARRRGFPCASRTGGSR